MIWTFLLQYYTGGLIQQGFYFVSLRSPRNRLPIPIASASGAGGRGFDPGPGHTKDIKNGTSGYLAWRAAL